MPGPQTEETFEASGQDDFDDIQTLKNLLELRSFMRRKQSLEEPLD